MTSTYHNTFSALWPTMKKYVDDDLQNFKNETVNNMEIETK